MNTLIIFDEKTNTYTKIIDETINISVKKKYAKRQYKEYFLKKEQELTITKLSKRARKLGDDVNIKNVFDVLETYCVETITPKQTRTPDNDGPNPKKLKLDNNNSDKIFSNFQHQPINFSTLQQQLNSIKEPVKIVTSTV